MLWRSCLAALLVWESWSLSWAGILGTSNQTIDFTKPDAAAQTATWSDPEKFQCTNQGFGWDGDAKESRDGWIETAPLGIGTSWRPTNSAQIRITLETNYQAVMKTGPSSKAFYVPSIYVRHSPDREHWSHWQPLDVSEDSRQAGTVLFTTRVGVARRDGRDYYERLQVWSRRDDVAWASDEEAFCQWLVQQEPDYFARHRPFVGYVQFLMEDSFRGGQRLKSFQAEVSWAVGGIHAIPKDPAAEKKHYKQAGGDNGWRFRAAKK